MITTREIVAIEDRAAELRREACDLALKARGLRKVERERIRLAKKQAGKGQAAVKMGDLRAVRDEVHRLRVVLFEVLTKAGEPDPVMERLLGVGLATVKARIKRARHRALCSG